MRSKNPGPGSYVPDIDQIKMSYGKAKFGKDVRLKYKSVN